MLAAARASFGTKGYAQTSVDEIAAAARVTKGAVYHHFAGKEALFRAVYARSRPRPGRVPSARATRTVPPIDQIVAQLNAYLDAALDPEIRRITLIDGPAMLGLDLDPDAEQEAAHAAAAVVHRRGDRAGRDHRSRSRRPHRPASAAWRCWADCSIARSGDPDATRAALGRALEAMLRGLAPDGK